jgi:hydrogenase-4 component F
MIYLFLVITALLSGVTYFVKNRILSHALVFVHLITVIALGAYILPRIGEQFDDFFFCDRIGLIFFIILIIVSLVSALHYLEFVRNRDVKPNVQALHNAGTIFFTGAMVGVLLTSHFGILWAFMEATTLGASVLIYHNRTSESLEATWKYLFISSIGIALAFAGVLFLGLAGQQIQNVDFTFATVKSLSSQLNPLWLKACFLLILTGFSVKLGLVPLYNVDIDAKDASPSQVGASLSSVLMNAGFVAIYRFYEAFSSTSILPWMNKLLMITGLISLFFAAAYMLKVRNVKRPFRLFQHGTRFPGDDCFLMRGSRLFCGDPPFNNAFAGEVKPVLPGLPDASDIQQQNRREHRKLSENKSIGWTCHAPWLFVNHSNASLGNAKSQNCYCFRR